MLVQENVMLVRAPTYIVWARLPLEASLRACSNDLLAQKGVVLGHLPLENISTLSSFVVLPSCLCFSQHLLSRSSMVSSTVPFVIFYRP